MISSCMRSHVCSSCIVDYSNASTYNYCTEENRNQLETCVFPHTITVHISGMLFIAVYTVSLQHVINPQRMREGYSTHLFVCVCVCVSLTTLEATLIYSAKNGHHWTANSILFIFKKLKFCKSAPSILKQPSRLTALYRTSYGHTHLLKFKVHFKGKVSMFSRARLGWLRQTKLASSTATATAS